MISFRLSPVRAVAAVLLLSGCTHDEPFSTRTADNDGPFGSFEPLQLTRSTGQDLYPSWRPDGQAFIYSFVDPVTADWCLSVLPAVGGNSIGHRCPVADPRNDSLDVMVEAAIRNDGQIAWMESQNVPDRGVPDRSRLFLGTLDPRQDPVLLLRFPYLATTGSIHLTATFLRWLPHQQLAYIGTDLLIRSICYGCKPDTITIGREIMVLDATRPGSIPVPVERTSEATSMWPTADSTGLYYTLAGDTRVWRRSLEESTPEVVYDFAGAGIVRDVSVVGNLLAAVVGGKVNYGFETVLGLRQVDSGGVVTTLDLATHEIETYRREFLYRRPVLSPDGSHLIAERVTFPQTHADLWLFRLR